MWHSIESKYELISAGMFTVSTPEEPTHSFMVDRNQAWYALEECKEEVCRDFIDHSNEDKQDVLMKVEFNNFMHFATLIPFLLDEDPTHKRARAAYYESLRLGNKFCKDWGFHLC